MRKTFLLNIFALFIVQLTLAQTEWAEFTTSGNTYFYDSDQDASGNIYLMGKGPATIGNYNIPISGGYIVKYDTLGNLLWFKQLGNTISNLSSNQDRALAVTDNGEVFFQERHNNVDVINGNTLNTFPLNSIVIGKLDSAGNYIWVKELELNILSSGRARIAHDGYGDIYITTTTNTNINFFQKYNGTTGNLIWTRQWQNTSISPHHLPIGDLVCETDGDCYITGNVEGAMQFLNDTSFTTNNYSKDILLVKYDSSGTRQWLKVFGDPNEDDEDGQALALTDNEIYLSSLHSDDVLFDSLTVEQYQENSFSKIRQDNGEVLWVTGHEEGDAYDIMTDENENLYIAIGSIGDFLEIDTLFFRIVDSLQHGYYAPAVMRLDSSGEFLDVRRYAQGFGLTGGGMAIHDMLWNDGKIILSGGASTVFLFDTIYNQSSSKGFVMYMPFKEYKIEIDSLTAPTNCLTDVRKVFATTDKHYYANNFYVNISNNIGTYRSTVNQGSPYQISSQFIVSRNLDSIQFTGTSFYPFGVKHTARICAFNPFHCSEPFPISVAKIDYQQADTICLGDTIQLSALNALSYQWSSPHISDTLYSSTANIAPDSTSYIYLDALALSNCVSRDSILAKVINLQIQNLADTVHFECNDEDGELTLYNSVAGGSGNYNYNWTPNYNIIDTTVGEPTILEGHLDQTYTVQIYDSFYECYGIDSVFIDTDSCNVLRGTISTDQNSPLQNSTVELYAASIDSLIKTTTTDLNGEYAFSTSDTSVYVRAKPLENLYPFELNTYYDSTFYKYDANPIQLSSDTTDLSFHTLTASDSIGNITFTGQIFYFDTPSIPVQNLEIQLVQVNSQIPDSMQNINNLIVREATTDNDGLFVFDDLPVGNYEIWGNTGALSNQLAIDFPLNNSLTNIVFYWQDSTLVPCLSTLNSDCVLINGTIYADADSNCLQAPGEISYPFYPVKIEPGPIYLSTDSTGYYSILALVDTFSVSTTLPAPSYWEETCTNLEYEIVMDTVSTTTLKLDFGFRPANYFEDAQSFITQYTPTRPGFDTKANIAYQNIGTLDLYNLTLVMHHDTSLIYQSNGGGLLPSFIGTDKVEWFVDTLKVGEHKNFNVLFNLIPDVNLLGDTLIFVSEIVPTSNEETPFDNWDTTSAIVTGSYDPNDKQVSPGYGPNGNILKDVEKLTYLIRFQNTGTDTAFTVVIIDTLKSQLEPLTLRTLSASHTYNFELVEGGIAKWTFNNILLPDSTTNLEGSNGFVKFEINFKDSLQIGDTIQNRAAIYFDFNPPIITNTVLTTVVEEIIFINTFEPKLEEKVIFRLFPNPTKAHFTIHFQKKSTYFIELFDALGRKIQEQTVTDNFVNMKISNISSGLYYVKVTNTEGYSAVQKLVKN